tara:strand:+ start:116 stop:769 length:654 start_codon:yes stop_codon:yes gene_type:complete
VKKYILFSLFIIFIFVAFNKTILSKIIVFSLSKWVERDFLVKEVNINYSAKEIVFNFVEIRNEDKFFYNNIFEIDKIQLKYDLSTFLTDLVKVDYLFFENIKFFLEFDEMDEKIVDDNIGLAIKNKKNYEPKIYPKKRKDKNFLVKKTELINSKVFIKSLGNDKEIKVNLSNMSFFKISNKSEFNHYKNIFKIILNDIFFKVPDQKMKNLIKKTYKF